MTNFPDFFSVYDNVPDFGRTKSVSYRMWRGARNGVVARKVEKRTERKRFRRAVRKAKVFRAYRSCQ